MSTLECNWDEMNAVVRHWRVVVVDDNPDCILLLERTLTFFGASVVVASCGAEALALTRRIKPTFVMTDLSMPGMDGFSLLRSMQADPELCVIPVIAVTAHAMRGDREEILAAGFRGYLSKPYGPLEMVMMLLEMFPMVETMRCESPLSVIYSRQPVAYASSLASVIE